MDGFSSKWVAFVYGKTMQEGELTEMGEKYSRRVFSGVIGFVGFYGFSTRSSISIEFSLIIPLKDNLLLTKRLFKSRSQACINYPIFYVFIFFLFKFFFYYNQIKESKIKCKEKQNQYK